MEMLSKTLQFTVYNSAEDMDDQQKEQRGQILPQSYVAWLRKWAGEKAFPMKKFRKAVTGARGPATDGGWLSSMAFLRLRANTMASCMAVRWSNPGFVLPLRHLPLWLQPIWAECRALCRLAVGVCRG